MEGSAGLLSKVSHSLCELRSVILRSGVRSDCEQKKFSRMAISKLNDITRRTHSRGDCNCWIRSNISKFTENHNGTRVHAIEPEGFMPQSVALDHSACAEAKHANLQDVPEHDIPRVAR